MLGSGSAGKGGLGGVWMGFSLEEGEREHTMAGGGVYEAGGRAPLPVYQVLVVLWVLCLHVALLQ